MKKTIVMMMAATFVAGILSTSCTPSATKIEKAQENVKTATDNLVDANIELSNALNDSIKMYKTESETRITYYEKSIAEFKLQLAKEKGENKVRLEKKVAELEQKSKEMKKDLADYTNEGQDKWTSFKKEFSHDLDELGNAFKDVTTNNVK